MKILTKYWYFIVSFLASCLFFFTYFNLKSPNFQQELSTFQEKFTQNEEKVNKLLQQVCLLIEKKEFAKMSNLLSNSTIDVHVFRTDSLVFWNTNKTPISRFVEIHFPSNGLLKLQNGWYFAKAQKVMGHIVSCSFLIKNEFLVENEYLSNDFGTNFAFPFKGTISLDKEIGYPIKSMFNRYLFSIELDQDIHFSDAESNFLMCCWLVFLCSGFIGIVKRIPLQASFWKTVLFIGMTSCVYILLIYFLSNHLNYIRFLDPTLFALSSIVPNFFVLFSHVIFVVFLLFLLNKILINYIQSTLNEYLPILLIPLGFFLSLLLLEMTNSIVKDSSIPLEINKLFQLNSYTVWAIITIGLLLFSYLIFIRIIALLIWQAKQKKRYLVLLLICDLGFSFYAYLHYHSGNIILFFPLIFFSINYVRFYLKQKQKISFLFVNLLFVSLLASVFINESYLRKEHDERKLYANQLASEQDISTEINFKKLATELATHHFFDKIFDKSKLIRSKELKDFMDKNFYKDFWERYEVDYVLYDDREKKTLTPMSTYDLTVDDLKRIIATHSKPSEITKDLYYIKDYTNQLSYISKIKIQNRSTSKTLTLYAVYKSKRIPEKIGFPKLLISQHANVLKVLEKYSVAKYYHRKLVSQSGDFSYPTNYRTLLQFKNTANSYHNYEGYDHLVIKKNDNDIIVLSKKEHTFFKQLTSFSYLFCFFGVILLLIIGLNNWNTVAFLSISFASKIQFTLIGIILISLLAFGFGSSLYIKQQYEEYASKLIKEKMQSIHSELSTKISHQDQLSMETDGEALTNTLAKLSTVFFTDINMYDPKGYLIATSRQKIFNLGLISEQINASAYHELRKIIKNDFIQEEHIGKLNYLSAYFPLYNRKNKLISFVNLQYFDQQQGYAAQIESFLVSIINIFILLLVFSILIAIMVSNWLINPLRILKESLANVQMGKYNEPIAYAANDEIGALVKNYNQKLNDLAIAANQLAQSEREFAWREMAKQVAHEIKNPLTPMKLSLQHLQRVYDPQSPLSVEKLNKVIVSLIEQIDTLTQIANEFSNFAKMPKENLEIIDLAPILANVVLIYQEDHHLILDLKCSKSNVKGDKNLLLQVFNNLITNAIQASKTDSLDNFIHIILEEQTTSFLISFIDNGSGINEEASSRMFEPNFTTKNTGSGLGLALSKQIVEAHGGKIYVESQKDELTKFYIELPKI